MVIVTTEISLQIITFGLMLPGVPIDVQICLDVFDWAGGMTRLEIVHNERLIIF